jgi:iron-sulfur cluster repair protein YtfE (RIC family)
MSEFEHREQAEKLTPSQVRIHISGEHKQLRKSLVSLQSLARTVSLDEEETAALCTMLRGFIATFERHLESEETLLLPLVEQLDAWGPMRAAHMRGEHFMQRSLLQEMYEKAGRVANPLAFAIEVDALVLQILADMRDEEAALLGPETLRDDLITIDQTCG